MSSILVVHGANLNLLGDREKDIYGDISLEEINAKLVSMAEFRGIGLIPFFSNHEGYIVDFIQDSGRGASGLIINPAAFTHTSVAIRDAILARDLLMIEVHLSNIYKREGFRRRSYYHDIALGVIVGLGYRGYYLALDYMLDFLFGDVG